MKTNQAQSNLLAQRTEVVSQTRVEYPRYDSKGNVIGTFSFIVQKERVIK